MLGYTQVFIAVANPLEAEQEPPRSYSHVLSHVFGARAKIARCECPLTCSNDRLVEVVEVPGSQPGARLLCDGGSIRTDGRDIDARAELLDLRVAHARTYVSPCHTEP